MYLTGRWKLWRLDYFASTRNDIAQLAATTILPRLCEERSDVAIQIELFTNFSQFIFYDTIFKSGY